MAELWPLPDDPLVPEIRAFADRHRLGERSGALDRGREFPRAEFRAMGEAGLLGLTVRPALGGRGLPAARAAVLLFHLAYLGGTAFAKLSLQPEFSSVLSDHGAPDVVDEWFRPMVRGERVVGNQITEATAGSDATALTATVAPDGDAYLLTGLKTEVAMAADADAAIVYARAPGSSGHEGISAFLVPQDLPGVERTVEPPDLGERWQRRGFVRYREVRLPSRLRLGEEGAGFRYVLSELAHDRGLLAAIYLGVARASWDETVRYVGQRMVFRRPLSDQQSIAFALVEDGLRLEAAWMFALRALGRLSEGAAGAAETGLAKALATEVALHTIDHAIQFHGGRGYSGALPHEQRWRDVRSGSIAHGPSEVLYRAAARQLWPRGPAGNP